MYDIWKGSARKEHIIENIQVYGHIKFLNHYAYKETSRATAINKKKEWSKSSDAIIRKHSLYTKQTKNLAELHC